MTTGKQSGIYRIKNTETGVMYVGQTSQPLARRWRQHRNSLKEGRHKNAHLQNSYNKHGKGAFEFKVLEVIPRGDMSNQEFSDYINEREIILIDKYDTFENGYNFTEGGRGMMGYKVSEEARAKNSAAHMGKKSSAEHRARLSAAQMGNARTLGYKHTAETKAKISASKTGKSTALKGKPWSPARRAAYEASKERL